MLKKLSEKHHFVVVQNENGCTAYLANDDRSWVKQFFVSNVRFDGYVQHMLSLTDICCQDLMNIKRGGSEDGKKYKDVFEMSGENVFNSILNQE